MAHLIPAEISSQMALFSMPTQLFISPGESQTGKLMSLKYNVFFIIFLCGLLPYVALLLDVYGEVHTATLAQSCFLKPQHSLLHSLSDFCLSLVKQLLLVTQVFTHVPGYLSAGPQRRSYVMTNLCLL